MDIVEVPNINLEKVCRTCLNESEDMHSIFSEFVNEEGLQNDVIILYEILTNISSIKVTAEDGLPTLICTSCMEIAHTAYKFQQQCNRSHELLEAYVSHIKDRNLIQLTCQTADDFIDVFDPGVFPSGIACDEIVAGIEQDSNILSNEVKEEIEERVLKTENEMLDAVKVAASEENTKLKQKLALKRMNNTGSKNKHFVKSKSGYLVREGANGNKVYICEICHKSYKFVSSLKIHMRTHTLEKAYVCSVCGKAFKQYGSFVYHNRSHSDEQPYVCTICGKRYKQSGSLTAHMRVHTGQRPFLCSVCGRGFRQAPDLKYHMRTHTKERPYMCTICGKTMTMQCHLVQHMRTHTGERPFQCRECHKAFPSSSRLKRHEITHTDLKPYTCDVCDKSFNRSSSLKVHIKIHSDDRPHVCPICGKGFIQAHTLKNHVVMHATKDSSTDENLKEEAAIFSL